MPLLSDASVVKAEDLQDLATFFDWSEEDCRRRLLNYDVSEMADAWRRNNPQSPEEIRAFYSATELYIWELVALHNSRHYAGYLAAIDHIIEQFPPTLYPRVLDYGCGIGTTAIRLGQAGYQVTIADVPGKTLTFALHRLTRRELPVQTIEVRADLAKLNGPYDILVCFEVLEHVPNPVQVLGHLVNSLRSGGMAALTAAFEDDERYPHHLSEGIVRFGGGRWDMLVESHNLDPLAWKLYRKGPDWRVGLRRWQYSIWRKIGVYPGRSAVLDRRYFEAVYRAHSTGDLDTVRKNIYKGLLNNPARLADRGVQSILVDALLGNRVAGFLKKAVRACR